MVKKRLIRTVFETFVKCAHKVKTPVGELPVLTWLITLNESSKRIHLNAVTRFGLVSVESSYPFGSVTSAYRFMVRL